MPAFPGIPATCWDNKTSSILKHIPTLNPLWKRELFLRCLVWKQSSGKSSFPLLITTNHREIPENSLRFHNSHVQKDGVTAWIPGSQRSFPTESVLRSCEMLDFLRGWSLTAGDVREHLEFGLDNPKGYKRWAEFIQWLRALCGFLDNQLAPNVHPL